LPATGSSINYPSASSAAANSSNGISIAATAGIAAAVVAICLVAGAFLFIFIRKNQQKRRAAYQKPEDEKTLTPNNKGPGVDILAVTEKGNNSVENPTSSEQAPRVSLRHVSRFVLPSFPENNAVRSSTLGETTNTARSDTSSENGNVGLSAPPASNSSNEKTSIYPTPSQMTRSLSRKQPPPALVLGQPNSEAGAGSKAAGTAITTALTATAATTAASSNGSKDGAKSLQALHGHSYAAPLPSPAPSNFTDSSESVTAAASEGIPISASAAPVHRVQMDFMPSMGDELELHAGQLVKVLHEYDDGWALCIRLDRSQQGVCPRTCLSQRPIKPRPGPGAPSGRNSPSHTGSGFPVSGRSQSPHEFPRPGSAASRQFPAPGGRQTPTSGNQLPAPASGANGLHPPTDRPKSPVLPDSPTTPHITISSTPDSVNGSVSKPTTSVAQPLPLQPQNPKPAPRPAVAPIKPSPLSNQTSTSDDDECEDKSQGPMFHAI
jgi:hypothetical protein